MKQECKDHKKNSQKCGVCGDQFHADKDFPTAAAECSVCGAIGHTYGTRIASAKNKVYV